MSALAKAVMIISTTLQGGTAVDHIDYSSIEQCRKGMVEYVAEMAPINKIEIQSKGTNHIRGTNNWTSFSYFYIRCLET